MTAKALDRSGFKDGALYHSPLGLWRFQVDGVVEAVFRRDMLAVWATGMGKTHLAMATAALLFEEGEIDHVVVCCESDKLPDWQDDFDRFTRIMDEPVPLYMGAKRKALMQDLPRVVVSTYDTLRRDLMAVEKVRNARGRLVERDRPGALLEALRGRRTLLVYDEMPRLRTRTSLNHRAHRLAVKTLREDPGSDVRVLGMTATPVERSPEDFYNLGRIMCPERMCTVAAFEERFVHSYDRYDNPMNWYDGGGGREDRMGELREMLAPVLHRKRKTDPDVIDFFPRMMERALHVRNSDRQQEFYRAVSTMYDPPEGVEDERSYEQEQADETRQFSAARLVCGHPAALAYSRSPAAVAVVEQVTQHGLEQIGSAKMDRLVERLRPVVKGEGAKAVVFTYFANTVYNVLEARLRQEGFVVARNHPSQTPQQKREAREAFREGDAEVFLTSDAGARGLNLQAGSVVFHYEMPSSYAIYDQRLNRIHRIDSRHESVTSYGMILDGTLEEGFAALCVKRNGWQDQLIDADLDEGADERHVTAEMRRRLLAISGRRR